MRRLGDARVEDVHLGPPQQQKSSTSFLPELGNQVRGSVERARISIRGTNLSEEEEKEKLMDDVLWAFRIRSPC